MRSIRKRVKRMPQLAAVVGEQRLAVDVEQQRRVVRVPIRDDLLQIVNCYGREESAAGERRDDGFADGRRVGAAAAEAVSVRVNIVRRARNLGHHIIRQVSMLMWKGRWGGCQGCRCRGCGSFIGGRTAPVCSRSGRCCSSKRMLLLLVAPGDLHWWKEWGERIRHRGNDSDAAAVVSEERRGRGRELRKCRTSPATGCRSGERRDGVGGRVRCTPIVVRTKLLLLLLKGSSAVLGGEHRARLVRRSVGEA